MPDGAGDAAAAAAQVKHSCVHLVAHEKFLHHVHQHLRVHPGDEHIGRHLHGQAVKLPGACDVGHGLTLEPAGHKVGDLFLHLF